MADIYCDLCGEKLGVSKTTPKDPIVCEGCENEEPLEDGEEDEEENEEDEDEEKEKNK